MRSLKPDTNSAQDICCKITKKIYTIYSDFQKEYTYFFGAFRIFFETEIFQKSPGHLVSNVFTFTKLWVQFLAIEFPQTSLIVRRTIQFWTLFVSHFPIFFYSKNITTSCKWRLVFKNKSNFTET